MIRIFNHYLHRGTLAQLLFEMSLILVAVLGIGLMRPEVLGSVLVPVSCCVVLMVTLFVINSAVGLNERYHNRTLAQTIVRALVALLFALPAAFVIFSVVPAGTAGSEMMQLAAMVASAGVVVHRVVAAHGGTRLRRVSRVLVYGCGEAAADVGSSLAWARDHAEVVGYVMGPNERDVQVPMGQVLRPDRPLSALARDLKVDEIVVALSERRGGSMPLRELLDCKLSGIRVLDTCAHFEKVFAQIRLNYVYAGNLIFGEGFSQGWLRPVVKRVFDTVCAIILLLVSLPVMLLTALCIKLESRGPVFYRQERVGFNGQIFEVIKFRSMRVDAEKDGPRWASKNDDRVTRVGRIIRKLRIDELPQLFNVLRGEMSLVGPRPERPYFVEQLTQKIPYYAVRQSIKPGLTGWAQVRYHYGDTVEDAIQKLQYDLYYVKNHTLFLDLVILFETIAVVLAARGAR
jgi:sugar transferase (PEP-CTERM system associated)